MEQPKIKINQFPTTGEEQCEHTITPTLGTQRALAHMVLQWKYKDGCDVDPAVHNWAIAVLGSDDLESDECVESFRAFKVLLASHTRDMIFAIANNGFNPLTEIPATLQARFIWIHAFTQAVPAINSLWGDFEKLERELKDRFNNQYAPVLDEWANAHIADPCPIKRKTARDIHHRDMMGRLNKLYKPK